MYRSTVGYFSIAIIAGAMTTFAAAEVTAETLKDTQAAAVATAETGSDAKAQNAGAAKGESVQARLHALQEYIGTKYKVPTKSVKSLVDTAWEVGGSMKLDPLLLLAVMAIESSFNPRAESHMGAQGLMQVMTRIHHKKFEPFGGRKAAWQPDANIKVGAQILKDCIEQRGSISGGLTCYVGSPGKTSKYGHKVLAERKRFETALGPVKAPLLLAASQEAEQEADTSARNRPTVDEEAARIVAEGNSGQVALNEITASFSLRSQTM